MVSAEVCSELGPDWEEVRAVCEIQREVKDKVSVTGVEGNKEGTKERKVRSFGKMKSLKALRNGEAWA